MENLQKHCQICAAEYKCLTSREELYKLLNKFLLLANKYNMLPLKQTVEEILQLY